MRNILILTSIIFSLTVVNYSFGAVTPRESFGIYNEQTKPVPTKPVAKPVPPKPIPTKPLPSNASGHTPSHNSSFYQMPRK